MIKKILLGLVAALAAYLGYVATLPSDFHIERSIRVKAKPDLVFEQVNDLRKFRIWNPWMNYDADIELSYEGPEIGMGSIVTWVGKAQVGTGRLEIFESLPPTSVRMKEDYTEPFKSTSVMAFTLQPDSEETLITWVIAGTEMPFVPKLVSTIFSLDKMIGREQERGLAQMKTLVEAPQ